MEKWYLHLKRQPSSIAWYITDIGGRPKDSGVLTGQAADELLAAHTPYEFFEVAQRHKGTLLRPGEFPVTGPLEYGWFFWQERVLPLYQWPLYMPHVRIKDTLSGRRGGFYGTPAEHATDFQMARQELLEAIQDSREAMSNGQCLVAGTRIDNGYVAYGRMQANAYDGKDISEAARLLKELKNADEPFEKKCVRTEPLSETHERTMRVMRPGLAGVSDELEKLKQAQKWLRKEFNRRHDGYSHPSHLAARLMEEAEARFGLASYGVEGWTKDVGGRRGVQYLNYGDTYAPTVVALSTPTSVRFVLAAGGWEPYA